MKCGAQRLEAQEKKGRTMRNSTTFLVIFFAMNTMALAQPSGSPGDTSRENDGTARNHPALSAGMGKSGNMNHGGLIAPHTPNDRDVIPANPSTDKDIQNPGNSQNFITNAVPKSQ